MGLIAMSERDQQRIEVLSSVIAERMTLVFGGVVFQSQFVQISRPISLAALVTSLA